MYSKVSYCTILIGAQHKFCKTKGSNSKVCSVQTPYKALLCKACKRLTKQSFVWREVLPPYKALLCKACKPKVCRLRREVLPPYKALLCKACKPKVCRLRREVLPPYKALLCKACKPKVCRLRREVLPPYKALLCKACKRLTKQSFVWLAKRSFARSFAAFGEEFCRLRLAKRSFARNFWRHRKERRTK